MREKVLEKLTKNRFVSGQQIATELNISRTAVYKHIKMLERLGFKIQSVPKKGYRLESESKKLHPLVVNECLNTTFVGRPIVHFEQVSSTINQAMLKAENADEGLTVVAEKQVKGRGRFQRKWSSPKGGIWASIILKPNRPTAEAAKLNLIASLAISEAIDETTELDSSIKWPNDVLVKDLKVAGVLTEIVGELDRISFAVVSFGINVNNKIPVELKQGGEPIAISLKEAASDEIDRISLFCNVLEKLEEFYLKWKHTEFDEVLEKWKKRCKTIGEKIEVKGISSALTGKAIDIDENGHLILKTADGIEHNLSAGEVTTKK